VTHAPLRPAGRSGRPRPPPSSSGPVVADGLRLHFPLAEVLASARQAGASIVIAHGTLTGRPREPTRRWRWPSDAVADAGRSAGGPTNTTVWLYTATGPVRSDSREPMPGHCGRPDGALFGVVLAAAA